MKTIAARIGPNRVAALLVAGALALEILRVEVVDRSGVGAIVCTAGEVLFLAAAAAVFVAARRSRPERD